VYGKDVVQHLLSVRGTGSHYRLSNQTAKHAADKLNFLPQNYSTFASNSSQKALR
jgi:hypothetical protein